MARLDDPKVLKRKLQDNVDGYHVEAVGIIKHTHRFRALADFYWDMSGSDFAQRYVDEVLPGNSKLYHVVVSYGIILIVPLQSRN